MEQIPSSQIVVVSLIYDNFNDHEFSVRFTWNKSVSSATRAHVHNHYVRDVVLKCVACAHIFVLKKMFTTTSNVFWGEHCQHTVVSSANCARAHGYMLGISI